MEEHSDESVATPLLSVVVPTHRRPAAFARLMSALQPQLAGRADRELIAINDGTDNAAYQAEAERFADVLRYVALPANRGQAAARNEGARLARGRWLVFTDDDCVPPAWWLDWLEALLVDAPDVDCVAGAARQLQARGVLLERFLIAAELEPKPFLSGGEAVLLLSGILAVRRCVFEQVGGFEEWLRSAEDRDLTYRLRRTGARMLIDHNWYVWHDAGETLWGHLRRYQHYGYWMPIQDRRERRAIGQRDLPASRAGWPLHVARLWRRNFRRATKIADDGSVGGYAILGFLTDLALDIGYGRGLRALRAATWPPLR